MAFVISYLPILVMVWSTSSHSSLTVSFMVFLRLMFLVVVASFPPDSKCWLFHFQSHCSGCTFISMTIRACCFIWLFIRVLGGNSGA
jgi:hypothetical protein